MKGDIVMSKEKLDELIAATKLGELISKKEDEDKKCCKKCSTIIIAVLAIVGAVQQPDQFLAATEVAHQAEGQQEHIAQERLR